MSPEGASWEERTKEILYVDLFSPMVENPSDVSPVVCHWEGIVDLCGNATGMDRDALFGERAIYRAMVDACFFVVASNLGKSCDDVWEENGPHFVALCSA